MTDFATGLTGFIQQDTIAELVRALDDPFQAEAVPGRVREARRGVDKAPPEKRGQMQAGLQILADLYGGGLPGGELGKDPGQVRASLGRAFEAWRAARSGADRTEIARDTARALGGREDGATRLGPLFSGWGGEPAFAADLLAEWPRLEPAVTGPAERALQLLGSGDQAWPRLAVGHGLQRARVGGGTGLSFAELAPLPAGAEALAGPGLAALKRWRELRAETARLLADVAASGSSAPFAEWEKARALPRLTAALIGLAPFARDEARTKQVQEALASAVRVLEDEKLSFEHQAQVTALVQAAMSAVAHLGRRLKPDPALAAIRAAFAALERLTLPGLVPAVEVRLAQDAVLSALASLQPAVVVEPLVQKVNLGLQLAPHAPGGPGFARALGALLGGDAPGARGERLGPSLAWLERALQAEGRARVLAAQALWEALDRCVVTVGTAFARTWYAGTTGSGAPALRFVALAALDVVFPQARLDSARLLEPADRLHDKVRTRASELAARPALGEATRRAVLLWLEATCTIERQALEDAAALLGPQAFERRPLADKVEQLVALFQLLRGDVLPPARVEMAGLIAARAFYAPDPDAERELPAAAVSGLDAGRWATFARTLAGARGNAVLCDGLVSLAASLRPARPGDEPGSPRREKAERELGALLALVSDALPPEATCHLAEGLELALVRQADAARELGEPFDLLRGLGRLLGARPAPLMVGWLAAVSPDAPVRELAGRIAAWLQAGEARLEVPAAQAGSPLAAGLRALEDASAALRAPSEKSPPGRKRLGELGAQARALARGLGEVLRLLDRPDEPRLATVGARVAELLAGVAQLPLGETAGRAALLREAEAALSSLAAVVREVAPAPEHQRAAERLEAWARAVAAHRERFVTRVEQALHTGQLEPLVELGWDDPDDVVRAASGVLAGRHEDLLAFLRQLAGKREKLDASSPAAKLAWEAVRQGFVRARDLTGLLAAMQATTSGPLAWSASEAREGLLRLAARELGDDAQALRELLARVAAAPDGERDTPAWRQAHQRLVELDAQRGDVLGLAAHHTSPGAGPSRWGGGFTALQQLATNPVSLLVLAAPFAAVRLAPQLAPPLFLGLLLLLGGVAIGLLFASASQRESLLPGLLARVAVPLVALAALGQAGLLPPMGGLRLLALALLGGVGALFFLVSDRARWLEPGRAFLASLAALTLAVHGAFALGLALSLILPPTPLAWLGPDESSALLRTLPLALGGHLVTFYPGLLIAWVSLSVLVGAALERARPARG